MALEQELKTFEAERERLMATSTGKFALVVGDKVQGTYTTYAEALAAGYAAVGVDTPFLVKQVLPVDEVMFFSRRLNPCRLAYLRAPLTI